MLAYRSVTKCLVKDDGPTNYPFFSILLEKGRAGRCRRKRVEDPAAVVLPRDWPVGRIDRGRRSLASRMPSAETPGPRIPADPSGALFRGHGGRHSTSADLERSPGEGGVGSPHASPAGRAGPVCW